MIQQNPAIPARVKRTVERMNSMEQFAPEIRKFLRHDPPHSGENHNAIPASRSGDFTDVTSFEFDASAAIMFGATKPPEVGSYGQGFAGFDYCDSK